jgi:cysteinyl-tRNA synthetase
MYTCGPTVYAPAHIGNLRTFVVSDWWRRTLEWSGYQVESAMNVTDVDDKTIKGSREAGLPLAGFTNQYEKTFFADLESLNVERSDIVPHATEYIKNMIEMIKVLLAKDFAYQADDGIYFRIAKVKGYGALAQLKNQPSDDKETPSDFALWKFWDEADGEVSWEAPFGDSLANKAGKGRPGWHIECSAMIRAVLGDTIDLHLGGTDLIFPHHTNEIAQSEAVTGQPLARHWLHIAFVNMAGGKMAKSEGNTITLADIINHGFSPLAYRYWLLSAHYRTLMNFSWDALESSAIALKKLQNRIADLTTVQHSVLDKVGTPIIEYLNKFTEAINNDLNLPVALSIVWELLDDHNFAPENTLVTILEFDKILGLDLISATQPLAIPSEVAQLLADRESARGAGDFARADSLRQQITTAGYTVDDTSDGPKLRKI